MAKNVAVSVKARLKNIANEKGIIYDFVLLRFIQERFLFRLSKSEYKDNFTLKGGLVLTLLGVSEFRPTKDIDFLGVNVDNDQKVMKEVIKEICSVKVEDDGLKFLHSTITSEIIKEGADYEGIRIKFDVRLDSVEKKIAMDVGFGDALSSEVKSTEYPVLLDHEPANIRIYPYESVLSEKLEAIVKLNYNTSRMKDFFDIYFLAKNYQFEEKTLSESIIATFSKRKTSLKGIEILNADDFVNDSNFDTQWKSFLKRNSLSVEKSFSDIVAAINYFIRPVLEKTQANRKWNPQEWVWV